MRRDASDLLPPGERNAWVNFPDGTAVAVQESVTVARSRMEDSTADDGEFRLTLTDGSHLFLVTADRPTFSPPVPYPHPDGARLEDL